eukprot:1153639-Pelagomonas_calceolata.AAC.9
MPTHTGAQTNSTNHPTTQTHTHAPAVLQQRNPGRVRKHEAWIGPTMLLPQHQCIRPENGEQQWMALCQCFLKQGQCLRKVGQGNELKGSQGQVGQHIKQACANQFEIGQGILQGQV